MNFKVGNIIAFKEDIKSHIGARLILKAHIPVEIIKMNNHAIAVRLPNGKLHNVRLIEDRMYFATEMGKILYGVS